MLIVGESPVSHAGRIRYQRMLREAEGYLELGLPHLAIDVLDRMGEGGTFRGKQLYLRGEALRFQGRFKEAIEALEASADKAPSKIDIYLALGWCYKRTGQLSLAIAALQKGLEVDSTVPVLHYNLACYWTLASRKDEALTSLSEALLREPGFRDQIPTEPDFDNLRDDPDFQALVSVTV